MILHCGCKHEYQDEKHGEGNRVHNWAEKKKVWRCVVCLSEKSENVSTVTKK
jgi:hypothetical protein